MFCFLGGTQNKPSFWDSFYDVGMEKPNVYISWQLLAAPDRLTSSSFQVSHSPLVSIRCSLLEGK